MVNCVFCEIIAGRKSANIIKQNADVTVFLSNESDNHPLVVTTAHHDNIYSLDDKLGAAVMQEATRIAKAFQQRLGCDGVKLKQRNGVAAGQGVMHFHLHVIPKWSSASPVPQVADILQNLK